MKYNTNQCLDDMCDRWVCGKQIVEADILIMLEKSAKVMCNLEKVFPLAFFDMHAHLVCHLVSEVALCGPEHARWMYWVERYLKILKSWVRKPARREGSMVAGYLKSETLFHFGGMVSALHMIAPSAWEEAQDERDTRVNLLGACQSRTLDDQLFRLQIHNYVLYNRPKMSAWREEYMYESTWHGMGNGHYTSITLF